MDKIARGGVEKLILQKLTGRPKKLRVLETFSNPVGHFWGPLAAILDFEGGAALQVVSECPWRR